VAERIRRFNENNLPPSRFPVAHREDVTSDDRSVTRPIRDAPTIASCQLGETWRLWDLFGSDYRELSAEEHRTCVAARRLLPVATRGPLLLDWEVARDDARFRPMTPEESGQPDWKFSPESPSHVHAETVVDGHAVHVDWLHAWKFGPGRKYHEIRVFVNGRLAGRGGRCACSLGFGGNDLPAVAAIGQSAAITVALGPNGPDIELWTAHLIGRM